MKMRNDRQLVAGALEAWRILTDLPLPKGWLREDSAPVTGARVLIWFPLLGAGFGAAIAAAGWLFTMVSNRYAGAVLFAVLTLLFMLFKDSGRAVLLVVSQLLNLLDGKKFAPALDAASSDRGELDRRFGMPLAAVLAAAVLLMAFLIGMYGGKGALIPLFAGAFATQGELAAELAPEAGGIADPERSGRRLMWIVAALAALVSLAFLPTATAFGVLIVVLINLTLKEHLRKNLPELRADTVTWLGAAAELSLLACGFCWTIG